ncbi:hypothetical protein B2J88_01765 [Rhodococcus sp. SRB_17]|nr:hypothetical protein [Rhodococcus sp. SRB_17]
MTDFVTASRATYPWHLRFDPISELNYKNAAEPEWEFIAVESEVIGRNPKGESLTVGTEMTFDPIEQDRGALYNAATVQAMASLVEWHQLSTMQLSTLLATSPTQVEKTMMSLFNGGIVERLTLSIMINGLQSNPGESTLWRVRRGGTERDKRPARDWFEQLDTKSWLFISYGFDPMSAFRGQNSPTTRRHDLVSTEIQIKALEMCPGVIGLWGERFCGGNSFYNATELDHEKTRANVGDGAILTRDGKIIILEVDGNNSNSSGPDGENRLVKKAAAWTSICGRSDLDLCVVFVSIAKAENRQKMRRLVEVGVNAASKSYVASGAVRERGQGRVFTAEVDRWFPGPRCVSSDFRALTVQSAVNGANIELAPIQLGRQKPAECSYIENCVAQLHTPTWFADELHNVDF